MHVALANACESTIATQRGRVWLTDAANVWPSMYDELEQCVAAPVRELAHSVSRASLSDETTTTSTTSTNYERQENNKTQQISFSRENLKLVFDGYMEMCLHKLDQSAAIYEDVLKTDSSGSLTWNASLLGLMNVVSKLREWSVEKLKDKLQVN